MNWWKRRRLRIAREKYAYWKAKTAALERMRPLYYEDYQESCAQVARYEERVETLMREQ